MSVSMKGRGGPLGTQMTLKLGIFSGLSERPAGTLDEVDLSPWEGQAWVCGIRVTSVNGVFMGKRKMRMTVRAPVFSLPLGFTDRWRNPQVLGSTLGDWSSCPTFPREEHLLCREGHQAWGSVWRSRESSPGHGSVLLPGVFT